ncbi:Early nodulin-like protein 3 [Sesamum alatum]|uniref:Early nodulin-like protein 3 n=1 Tax=Sesamum alatum TaxID=300844 RepID=A0AAE1Z1T6_9LAMI|nr:Early nodulin-like protein 3 [Sesamum alatum]
MADHQAILRVNWKSLWVLGVVSLLMIQKGNAFQFKVGGSGGSWTVPADPNAAIYNHWAEKHRFQIGDSLLFVYDADHDSVLHVTKDDYTNCNTAAPLEKFSDGHTVFTFNQSGPYYFISGVADNCHKNEKLVVVVMADRSQRNSNQPASSPPPQESSPPNSAASFSSAGIVGTIAAFVGSSLLSVI